MQVSACFASADFHYSNSLASVQAHVQALCAMHSRLLVGLGGVVVILPAGSVVVLLRVIVSLTIPSVLLWPIILRVSLGGIGCLITFGFATGLFLIFCCWRRFTLRISLEQLCGAILFSFLSTPGDRALCGLGVLRGVRCERG